MKHQLVSQSYPVCHRAQSCMGPLLFLLYINDINDLNLSMGSKLVMYADVLSNYFRKWFCPLATWCRCTWSKESSEPSIFNASKYKSMVLSCTRLKTQPMSSPSIRLIAGESWLLQISWTKNQNATSLGPTTLRESDQKQGGLLGYSFDNSITMQNCPQ